MPPRHRTAREGNGVTDGITWYGSTHKGRRSTNQDGVLAVVIDENVPILLFAVADGMGGAAAGDVASSVALAALGDYVSEYFDHSCDDGPHDPGGILACAIDAADAAIRRAVRASPECSGMGSTLVSALALGDRTVVANIGDSRAYLLRNGRLHQITKDHTALQEMLDDSPELDIKEAAKLRNILTRVLDGNGHEPDILDEDGFSDWVASGEGLLLCSDGLLVKSRTLGRCPVEFFAPSIENLREDVGQLVDAAYDAGTTDNISVLCVLFDSAAVTHGGSRAGRKTMARASSGLSRLFSVFLRGPLRFRRSAGAEPGNLRLDILCTALLVMFVLLLLGFWWLWKLIR